MADFFVPTSSSLVFKFGKCLIHARFVFIKNSNISDLVWFKDVVDNTDSSFWYLMVILTDYEIG